jgi:glutaredoxin
MEEVTLYTRPGCRLCDEMKEALAERGYRVREVNVDLDPGLKRRYGHDVPVALRADGTVLARHRL